LLTFVEEQVNKKPLSDINSGLMPEKIHIEAITVINLTVW